MSKRENGAGSVYKVTRLKRRPWIAVAPAVYDDKGKPKRLPLGSFETAKEAREALRAYNQAPTLKYNLTVAEVFTEWRDTAYRNISKSTIDNYNAAYKRIAPLLNIKFRELRTQQMQAIIDDNAGLSLSTLSKTKLLLTQLYQYAIKNDIVNKDYAAFIVLPKQVTVPKDCFTDLEIAKIEQASGNVQYADVILVMCYTGFRIAEFLSLTPFSYDPQARTLRGGSKTEAGKNRIVPVHSKIQPIIDAWTARGGKTIFCRDSGQPYSAKLFRNKCYYPALEAIGVRRLSPHATRHTCATRLAAAGVRPEDIQKILGHADYDITASTYIHQSTETLQKAINLMP